MAFLKRKGRKGKTASVRTPSRKRAKTTRAIDVSLPAKLAHRPKVADILKFFSPSVSAKRRARIQKIGADIRRKARKTIDKGIDATAKIVEYGSKVAPVLLMGGAGLGAITPAVMATGLLGAQFLQATDSLIETSVKDYNKARSPTLNKHIEKADEILKEGITLFQGGEQNVQGVFDQPFQNIETRSIRRPTDTARVEAFKRAQDGWELLGRAKKRLRDGPGTYEPMQSAWGNTIDYSGAHNKFLSTVTDL